MLPIPCQLTPLAIEIVGDTAAVQLRYANTLVLKDGWRVVTTGRWTSALVKSRTGLLFLSNAYFEEK